MPIELWKQGKEIFNGQRFNNRLRYFPLFSFIWCNPQHYEGLKPSRYTGIINKNQIYIIMESQYKVCEVKLAENAYKILLSVFDSETIQYKEFFKVILMNRANKVLGVCHISEGGLNETSADIRIIMQAAILGNASAIILAHNHPSGNIQPSMQDDQVTKRVKEIAKLIGINLLDHLIITDETYYSYSENGRI